MLKSGRIDVPLKKRFWGYVNEFTIYAFLGWVYETIVETIFAGHLVLNRGMLHLPVCPIYGFGAFIALWIMFRFKALKRWQVFVGGTVITTVVEYIAALILENGFSLKLWDYTPWICDFQGRVSLISSLIFGLGCLGAYAFRPKCEIKCLNNKVAVATGAVFLTAMVVDFVLVVMGY